MMRQRGNTMTPISTPRKPASQSSSPAHLHRRGLYAYVGHRVVELLTEQQLVDHAVSVLPQLQSVTTRPHFHGAHWTTLRKKRGVDLFEFDPSISTTATSRNRVMPHHRDPYNYHHQVSSTMSTYSTAASSAGATVLPSPTPTTSSRRASLALPHGFQTQFKLPNPGIDMAYAVVAQCELDCHINDAMDALFSDEPIEFESSMKALWNNKLKRGDLLLTRTVAGPPRPNNHGANHFDTPIGMDDLSLPDPGSLAIKTATVGNGLSLKLKQLDAEKLCYTSFTQCSPSTSEAFHVVKTLPLDIHDQIVGGKTHGALRDASVDHIAVGYHLTGIDSLLGGGSRTRVVICGYASAVSSANVSRASQLHWHPRMDNNMRLSIGSGVGGHGNRTGGVNSDVRRLVMMLAKAACNFQDVIRQRRFGHQRFVYFPIDRSSCHALEQCCVVCMRRFGMFRKDHYCQLCGHLVCRTCSKKHKVERSMGKMRESRICFPCVARVDSCAYQEEQLWKTMDRPVVVDSDVISPLAFPAILEVDDDDDEGEGDVDVDNDMTHHADEEEYGDDFLALDYSYSSNDSEFVRSSSRPEMQVAHDLFSPNPRQRATALADLSRAVLDARNAVDTSATTATTTGFQQQRTPKARVACHRVDPVLVDKYMEEKQARVSLSAAGRRRQSVATTTPTTSTTTRPATSSDRMQTFSVCYPRANPTATPPSHFGPDYMTNKTNTAPLRPSASSHHDSSSSSRSRSKTTTTAAQVVDTRAFESICEVAVQRLHNGCVAFILVHTGQRARIVGLHQASHWLHRLPRDRELVRTYPEWLAMESNAIIVDEPLGDLRFRDFSLLHEAQMKFFAQFPIPNCTSTKKKAWLCVMSAEKRDHFVSKEEFKTVQTLCSLAADLVDGMDQYRSTEEPASLFQ